MSKTLEPRLTERKIQRIIRSVDWVKFGTDVNEATRERINGYAKARTLSRNRYQ